jgi:3',5'-cyclic AMP phosphodiesterase CpdA
MKFIQITDIHIQPPGQFLFEIDTVERLQACLQDVLKDHADAAFVTITGDLSHRGDVASYERLRDALAGYPLPVHMTLGNHDNRDNFRQVFPAAALSPGGFVQSAIEGTDARVLLLDSLDHREGIDSGVLCQRRLDWLAAQLAHDDARPVLIGLHHPPFPIGFDGGVDVISLIEPERLWAVLAPYREKVRHLFFGHVHRPTAGNWHGIPISTAFGTTYQAGLNIGHPGNKARKGPAEYSIFLVQPDGDVVVHFHDFLYGYPEVPGLGMIGLPMDPASRAASSEGL